jgi:hypothetical protein
MKDLAWFGMMKLERTPSCMTIRRWINQVGYHKLVSRKKKAKDWFYLVDNNVQLEEGKVCLILGGHINQLKKGKCLSFEDLEVIKEKVCRNEKEIEELIELAIKETGKPVMIGSDEGGDTLPVIQGVIARHPSIQHIPDISHKVSNLLEKLLSKDERWQFFFKSVTLSRNKLKGTPLSHLCPPKTPHFRFLHYAKIVRWALQVIEMLKSVKDKDDENREKIIEKLGWVLEIENDIKMFEELMAIGGKAKQIVRKDHLKPGMRISITPHTAIARKYLKEINQYLRIQGAKVGKGRLFVGSTEIIESAFSKLKLLNKENQGFTLSIIGLVACFGQLEFKDIVEAFESHTYSEVKQWEAENIGPTFLSRRKKALKPIKRAGYKSDAKNRERKDQKVA